jgi:hypothetical protein
MGNEVLKNHQAQISRNYFRRMSNLIKLGRFSEATQASIRFTGILQLWEIQQMNIHSAAIKDGCAAQRAEKIKSLWD